MYNEKERLQKNNNAKKLLNVKNNSIQRSVKPVTESVRVSYKNTSLISYPVLQFESDEKKIERIVSLCARHKYHISREEAIEYLNQMNTGIHPRIQNHNAVIRPWGNYFHIIQVRFGGMGAMGRAVENGGAEANINNTDNDYKIPPQYTMETFIISENLEGKSPRKNLASIMGGSAYDMTQIKNSEYLHMIAHSLGGQDEPENLIPGYHALNTAMIPIENFVRFLVTIGINVLYRVQMHPMVGTYNIWASGATMTIGFYYKDIYYEHSWLIQINSPERLNHNYYSEIEQEIQKFEKQVGLIN